MTLIDTIKAFDYNFNNIPAIEINSYKKKLNKNIFMYPDRDRNNKQYFVSVKGKEFLEMQFDVASALLEMGIDKNNIIAIFAYNSLYYAATVYAIMSIGCIVLPIYPSITENELSEILYNSECHTIFTGDISQFQKAQNLYNKVKSPIKRIITYFENESDDKNILNFKDLINLGEKSKNYEKINDIISSINDDDYAALIYTPGTSTKPRGALLSHGNFISQKNVVPIFNFNQNDVRIAHLPFSHVYGFSADLLTSAFTSSSMAICTTFDSEEIIRNIKQVKPNIIATVPRMYEKLYINVLHKIKRFNPIKRLLYIFAINIGRNYYIKKTSKKYIPLNLKILNRLSSIIHKKIRKMISMSQIRYLFSGGAPLPIEIAYFFGGIGLEIYEGYGLTETSPVVTINQPGKNKPGSVGLPIPGCNIKISDEGEVLVKGPMVFKEYLKVPKEEYVEYFTDDGYFKTGDIGYIDNEGYLFITSRLKDIIITSQGKNIVPLQIEKRFENEPFINFICVVGDKKKYLSALVVPNFIMLRQYAKENGIEYKDDKQLVEKPEIQTLYKNIIDNVCNELASYERIKKFTLIPHEFSAKTGELTPTFKFKRSYIYQQYKEVIDKMYPESEKIKL